MFDVILLAVDGSKQSLLVIDLAFSAGKEGNFNGFSSTTALTSLTHWKITAMFPVKLSATRQQKKSKTPHAPWSGMRWKFCRKQGSMRKAILMSVRPEKRWWLKLKESMPR